MQNKQNLRNAKKCVNHKKMLKRKNAINLKTYKYKTSNAENMQNIQNMQDMKKKTC